MIHMPNFLRRGLAATLAVCLAIPTVFAAVDDTKLSTSYEIAQGLTYTNTISNGSNGRRESFSLTLSPNSDVFPIAIQSSGTAYGAASISKAIALAESRGYTVLGGINSDYFSTQTGVPLGIAVEDGVYISSPTTFPAVAYVDGLPSLVVSPQVSLSITNEESGDVVAVENFNKWRTSAGGLYLLNENFSTVSSRTEGDGWVVRLELVEDEVLTLNSTLSLVVTELLETSEAVVIGEGNYLLTASSYSGTYDLFHSFEVGDEITIQTQCDDKTLSSAQWVSGTANILVENGAISTTTDWTTTDQTLNPRTAMGVKADGTTIYYVTDGRQSDYSMGLTQKDLAQELIDMGCIWAVNLDGGGSSSFAATLPGDTEATIQNSPSDGKARSAATFILLVTQEEGGTPHHLAMEQDGSALLVGSSITLDTIFVMDEFGATLDEVDISDITFTSASGGTLEGNVYSASTKGVQTIAFTQTSTGLKGSAEIQVVDNLTEFYITSAGSSNPLTSLFLSPGETVPLAAVGEYWLRDAVYGTESISWNLGDIGSITADGYLTTTGREGTITATLGGLTHHINVAITNVHNDVTSAHWSFDAVEYCYQNGIMNGISPTEFGVGQNIIRGDFVQVLYNAMGKPTVNSYTPYTDVSNTDYYAAAISWATEEGLASGYADGSFGAQVPITREQAFTILGRALDLLNIDVDEAPLSMLQHFTDYQSISSYAQQGTATLATNLLVTGSDGTINPQGTLSREEMATLMERFLTFDSQSIIPLEPPYIAPTALSLNRTDLVLLHNEVVQLTATLSPTDSTGDITWSSSDISIATVTQEGEVINVFEGIGQPAVTITATCGDLSASATVRCRPLGDEGDSLEVDDGITFPTIDPNSTEQDTDSQEETQAADPVVVPDGAPTATISLPSGSLNLRVGPGSSFAVIGTLSNGTPLSILDTLNGWYQVAVTLSGQLVSGFVSTDYVLLDDAVDVTPEPEPEPKPDVDATPQPAAPFGTVYNASSLNVRSSPSTSGTVLSLVDEGAVLTILDSVEGWHQITGTDKYGATVTGYVSADYIALPSPYQVVNASVLNVRQGGGSDYAIIDTLSLGDTLYVRSTADGWSYVIYADGEGYVSNDYIALQ